MTDQTARATFTLQDIADPATAGDLPLFHTVPGMGEYPSKITLADGSDQRAILVIDKLAYDRLQANFAAQADEPGFAGLLVDREHLSELPAGDSTACAWAKTLQRRDDGLWTGWELTDLGNQLIPTKRFKFRSPVFDLEKVSGTTDKWRPVKLVSIALTNVPHFKQLAPSLNRESGAEQGGSPMGLIDKLRALFGKPEAQEDELFGLVDAALKAGETAKTAAATAQARVQTLEKADTDRQADEFVKEHGAKVSDTAKLRARFIADPAGTRETVALLKAETKPAARALGRDAQTPESGAGDTAKLAATARRNAIAAVRQRDGCTHAQAAARAQRENPTLWQ